MKILRSCLIAVTIALWGLTACQETEQDRIRSLEQKYSTLLSADAGELDREQVRALSDDLSKAYLGFAANHEKDPKSVDYLFKAAELKEAGMADMQGALNIYDRIAAGYPDHPKAADALFRKAYIYHNLMGDLTSAEMTYRAFLERYPDHELAPSAEFELNNLGLSPEELFQRMQTDSTAVDSLSS